MILLVRLLLLDGALALLSLTTRELEPLAFIRSVDIRSAFQAKQILFRGDRALKLLVVAFSLKEPRQIILWVQGSFARLRVDTQLPNKVIPKVVRFEVHVIHLDHTVLIIIPIVVFVDENLLFLLFLVLPT